MNALPFATLVTAELRRIALGWTEVQATTRQKMTAGFLLTEAS